MNFFSLIFLSLLTHTDKPANEVKGNFEPIAVLELFTSQGCSSCPAADALLNKIVKEKNQAKIFGLSYHVNYWDYLGWQDPYGSKQFTERQSWYSTILKSEIYTPQMLINGEKELVGSDKSAIEKTIKNGLVTPAKVAIDLILNDHILTYTIHGEIKGTIINFALVQNEATNFVKKGENSGKTLSHTNIVRSLESRILSDHPSGEYKIRSIENISKAIVYLQNAASGKVLGATEIVLTQ